MLRTHFHLAIVFGLHLISLASAFNYHLTDNWYGSGFFSTFTHDAIPDPTHGRTEYVSESTARSLNLSYAFESQTSPHFILRADSTTTLSPSGAVMVADILHMPVGCGTWPALWTTLETNWPEKGEIDILEGVNDQGPNRATLHTTSGCTMNGCRAQTGDDLSSNCDWQVDGNTGCGTAVDQGYSYGRPFNSISGGYYAMERTPTSIKVWWWPRNAASIPTEVTTLHTPDINTQSWGVPFAYFDNQACDLNSKFGLHNVIINLTFCGDWAGQQQLYSQAGCPGTCVDYVNQNPAAFAEAYWDFRAIRMYSL